LFERGPQQLLDLKQLAEAQKLAVQKQQDKTQ
jgi:hypothetical protein